MFLEILLVDLDVFLFGDGEVFDLVGLFCYSWEDLWLEVGFGVGEYLVV